MKRKWIIFGMVFLLVTQVSIGSAQTEKPGNAATVPPKILLLVHQQFKFGSEGERRKLAVSITRACNRLDVPNTWIDLQSITGPPEALSFDPFDSFEQVDNTYVVWGQIFTAHSELARLQDQLRALE